MRLKGNKNVAVSKLGPICPESRHVVPTIKPEEELMETSSSSSPVLEQRVLWDLVVGHRLPEGVDLLKNELSDL